MLLSAITNNQTEKESSMKRLVTPPAWRECVGLVQEDDGGPRQAGTPERIPQRCLALTHVHAVQLHGGAGGGGSGMDTGGAAGATEEDVCINSNSGSRSEGKQWLLLLVGDAYGHLDG